MASITGPFPGNSGLQPRGHLEDPRLSYRDAVGPSFSLTCDKDTKGPHRPSLPRKHTRKCELVLEIKASAQGPGSCPS